MKWWSNSFLAKDAIGKEKLNYVGWPTTTRGRKMEGGSVNGRE